jgi:hypothetical protein
MKPEIYYDKKNLDLVWLPKHSKIIAEVAQELKEKGIYYAETIRGNGVPRSTELWPGGSYAPYVAWDCLNPEPLLNHPKIKEILMPTRTIPSKEQVLKAAASCSQTKEALKILFPQDFEGEFDWEKFKCDPFTSLLVDTEKQKITPSKQLKRAYEAKGTPIPGGLYPNVTLSILADLFTFLFDNAGD